MHVNDIVRLFFEDQSVRHYLVTSISDTTIRLTHPGGHVDLPHDAGLVSTLDGHRIVGVEVLTTPRHDEFTVGGYARLNLVSGTIRGKVVALTNGILELLVDDRTIYVDLDNLPATVRSVDIAAGADDVYDPEPADDVLDAPLQLHMLDNQLLSLYAALISDVHEDERSAPMRRAIHRVVTRYKHLHRQFTTEAFEPAVPENRMLTDEKFTLKWLYPNVDVDKHMYTDMAPLLADIESALADYADRSTLHRYTSYTEKMAAIWEPIEPTGNVVSVRAEGLAKRVRVMKRNEFATAPLFNQTYAPGDRLSAASYFMLPEAIPYARMFLPETSLYRRCVLHALTPTYYKCMPFFIKTATRLERPRIGGLLEQLEPFSVWDAIRHLEPYLVYKNDVGFKYQKLLLGKIRAQVSAYKASRPVPTPAPLSTPPTLGNAAYALAPMFASERLAAMLRIDSLRSVFGRASHQRNLQPNATVPAGYPGCLPDDCPSDDSIRASAAPPTASIKRVNAFVSDESLESRMTLANRLFSRYDVASPEDAPPNDAVDRLREYAAVTANGLTESNAAHVLGLLQRHARPARTGEDAGWLYLRDADLKYVPAFVETLSRALMHGGSAAMAQCLDAMTSVVVEDGHVLDKASGFIIGPAKLSDVDMYENGVKVVHSAVVPADVKAAVFSVNDAPLLTILRALSHSMDDHAEFIISRVRGLEVASAIPMMAAFISLIRETAPKPIVDRIRRMLPGMRAQKRSPSYKYWAALDAAKLDALVAQAMEVARTDVGVSDRPEPIKVVAGHAWPEFMPTTDTTSRPCVPVRSPSLHLAQGKLAACASHVVVQVRKRLHATMPTSAAVFQVLEPGLQKDLRYLHELSARPWRPAMTQLGTKAREGSFRGSLPPEIPLMDVVASNNLAEMLEEWDILNASGVDLTKLGAYVQAYTNHVRACVEVGRTPDLVHDLIAAACGGGWNGVIDVRDALVQAIRASTATIPSQIMLGFNNFSASLALSKSDRIMPLHAMAAVTPAHVTELLKDVQKSYANVREVASAPSVHRVFAARARGEPQGEAVLADAEPAVQFARNYDLRRDRFKKIQDVAALARLDDESIALLKFCLLYAWTLLLTDANGDRLVGAAKDYACAVVRACTATFQTNVKRLNRSATSLDSAMRKAKLREGKQFSLRITDDQQTRVRRIFLIGQGLTEEARLGRKFTHSKQKESLDDAMRSEYAGEVDQLNDENWQEEPELAYGEVDDGEGRVEWEDS